MELIKAFGRILFSIPPQLPLGYIYRSVRESYSQLLSDQGIHVSNA